MAPSSDDEEREDAERSFDYDIGFGRPPTSTQFSKGVSGNPMGRRRGSKNHVTVVRKVALQKVRVKVAGSYRRMQNLDLVIDAVRRQAAKGDPIALQLVRKYSVPEPEDEEPIPKGVLIVGEKLTLEEWEAKFGSLGDPRSPEEFTPTPERSDDEE